MRTRTPNLLAKSPSTKISRGDAAFTLALAVGMAVLYALAYKAHPSHPHIGGSPGWWVWFDQERYFKAAKAWAAGDLNPELHWYLPGYPLLAAPFIWLLSVHAFFAVDLLCLLLALWLFTRLAVRLAPAVPHAAAWGAMLFAATTTLSPLGLDIWVVPWSTSGAVPLYYACLLAATAFVSDPRRWVRAFQTGIWGGLVLAFRPSDMIPLLAACALGISVALVRQRPGWGVVVRGICAGVGGAIVAGIAMALTYLPLYGFNRSQYVMVSAHIGFDLGLVPLHWVTIVLSPQPLLSDGQGLIEAFPWIAAGMAGMAAFLLLPLRGAGRQVHGTVITAVILHTVVYLAYRDLQPGGLFRFWNYHYFKWMFPVLALYAALLVHTLLTMRGRRIAVAAVAAGTLAVLVPWRAELQVTGKVASSGSVANNELSFVSTLSSVRDAILVPASGAWGSIYLDPSSLEVGGHSFGLGDIKPVPRAGGFMLSPLRPLPIGPAVLTMDPRVRIDHSLPVLRARQDIVFGIPCWLPRSVHECQQEFFLPPPMLPSDGRLVFDGNEAQFLAGGWSTNEGQGRWTDGWMAEIRLRVPPSPDGYSFALSGYAYLPDRAPPLKVQISANGNPLMDDAISQIPLLSLKATVKASMMAGELTEDGAVPLIFTLRFANPRAPMDYDSTSSDHRLLGLFIRSITLTPRPE